MQEYFYKTFNKKSEHKSLKVTLFSEFPLSYPGGGKRLISLIHDFLKDTGIDATIIENTKIQKTVSVLKQSPSLNMIGVEFKRFGIIKFLYQDFPPIRVISSEENAVSLIFFRRVPPRMILHQLEKSNSKVIFCLQGIALERIRITNPIIIAHQLVMRVKLRALARYTRNHIFVQSLLPPVTTYLIKHGADSKNIFTIENQFKSKVTLPERNDEEFLVTLTGRMEDFQKGIKRLKNDISLVKKSDESIKFNIIGKGKDGRMLNGLGGNINIVNGIDDQRKNKIIAF